MRSLRHTIIIALILLLAGCGFHLRGAVELPEAMARLQVEAPASSALRYELEAQLLAAGVALAEEGTGAAILTLHSEQLRSRVLSVDPQGRAREHALSLAVTYSVQTAAGEMAAQRLSERVERDLRLDPDNVLAQGTTKEMLEQEMRRAAARQILLRLRSLARAMDDKPAQ